ncbi:hypothetical protein ABIE00_001408 [Arthrobacter sp. OAP107]
MSELLENGGTKLTARILCISFSDIMADSRVLRQLEVLSEFGEVTTLSYGEKPAKTTHHLRINSALPSLPQTVPGVLALALRRFKAVALSAPAVKAAAALASGQQFDLIVANEARALPLAHHLAAQMDGPVSVWGDMHEWAPEERAHVLSWRLLVKPFMTHVCREYLPRTQAVSAVNGSIAKLYEDRFGLKVRVVRNAGAFRDLRPSEPVPGTVRLVHSGAAIPGRNLEGMIAAVLQLDETYTLDFYLVKARDGGKYWAELKKLSAGSDRIRFHDAVAPDDLPRTLNQYDLGIFSLPPRTTNHRLMLPNKFFDFVQARLGLVFSPSPETSALIDRHDIGVVTRDYSSEALADAIRVLSPGDVDRFKKNADAAARALSSREDEDVVRDIVQRLLLETAV